MDQPTQELHLGLRVGDRAQQLEAGEYATARWMWVSERVARVLSVLVHSRSEEMRKQAGGAPSYYPAGSRPRPHCHAVRALARPNWVESGHWPRLLLWLGRRTCSARELGRPTGGYRGYRARSLFPWCHGAGVHTARPHSFVTQTVASHRPSVKRNIVSRVCRDSYTLPTEL
jgi:hypothetical protein